MRATSARIASAAAITAGALVSQVWKPRSTYASIGRSDVRICDVELLDLARLLVDLPLLVAEAPRPRSARRRTPARRPGARRSPLPPARPPPGQRMREPRLGRRAPAGRTGAPAPCARACCSLYSGARAQPGRARIEVTRYFLGEFVLVVVHSLSPLADSIPARAWTAREQWVFTLPSEHPIAAAASATSSSSQ